MVSFDRAQALLSAIHEIGTPEELADTLAGVSRELGFTYYALTHHVDIRRKPGTAIRLDNYPREWVEYYDARGFGVSDPVHRASHVTSVGFAWSKIPDLIALTPGDRDILAQGRSNGIGDGFTVPAHVPGEAHGSCSFANPSGITLREDELPLAQLIGNFAFEAARRLLAPRGASGATTSTLLTDRQRDCVLWVARGKTDWEIGRILGITEETVRRHIKLARERLGVSKRTLLAIRALFDGSLSFTDILKP